MAEARRERPILSIVEPETPAIATPARPGPIAKSPFVGIERVRSVSFSASSRPDGLRTPCIAPPNTVINTDSPVRPARSETQHPLQFPSSAADVANRRRLRAATFAHSTPAETRFSPTVESGPCWASLDLPAFSAPGELAQSSSTLAPPAEAPVRSWSMDTESVPVALGHGPVHAVDKTPQPQVLRLRSASSVSRAVTSPQAQRNERPAAGRNPLTTSGVSNCTFPQEWENAVRSPLRSTSAVRFDCEPDDSSLGSSDRGWREMETSVGGELSLIHACISSEGAARRIALSGCRLYSQGHHRRAEECFTQGLRLRPGDPVLLGNRSAARLAQGDAEGALQDADAICRTVGIPPEQTAQGHVKAALAVQQQGFAQAGAERLRLAHELDPGNSAIRSLLHRRTGAVTPAPAAAPAPAPEVDSAPERPPQSPSPQSPGPTHTLHVPSSSPARAARGASPVTARAARSPSPTQHQPPGPSPPAARTPSPGTVSPAHSPSPRRRKPAEDPPAPRRRRSGVRRRVVSKDGNSFETYFTSPVLKKMRGEAAFRCASAGRLSSPAQSVQRLCRMGLKAAADFAVSAGTALARSVSPSPRRPAPPAPCEAEQAPEVRSVAGPSWLPSSPPLVREISPPQAAAGPLAPPPALPPPAPQPRQLPPDPAPVPAVHLPAEELPPPPALGLTPFVHLALVGGATAAWVWAAAASFPQQQQACVLATAVLCAVQLCLPSFIPAARAAPPPDTVAMQRRSSRCRKWAGVVLRCVGAVVAVVVLLSAAPFVRRRARRWLVAVWLPLREHSCFVLAAAACAAYLGGCLRLAVKHWRGIHPALQPRSLMVLPVHIAAAVAAVHQITSAQPAVELQDNSTSADGSAEAAVSLPMALLGAAVCGAICFSTVGQRSGRSQADHRSSGPCGLATREWVMLSVCLVLGATWWAVAPHVAAQEISSCPCKVADMPSTSVLRIAGAEIDLASENLF